MKLGDYVALSKYKVNDLVEYFERPEETYRIKTLDLKSNYMEIVNVDKKAVAQSVHFHGIDPNHIKHKGATLC